MLLNSWAIPPAKVPTASEPLRMLQAMLEDFSFVPFANSVDTLNDEIDGVLQQFHLITARFRPRLLIFKDNHRGITCRNLHADRNPRAHGVSRKCKFVVALQILIEKALSRCLLRSSIASQIVQEVRHERLRKGSSATVILIDFLYQARFDIGDDQFMVRGVEKNCEKVQRVVDSRYAIGRGFIVEPLFIWLMTSSKLSRRVKRSVCRRRRYTRNRM